MNTHPATAFFCTIGSLFVLTVSASPALAWEVELPVGAHQCYFVVPLAGHKKEDSAVLKCDQCEKMRFEPPRIIGEDNYWLQPWDSPKWDTFKLLDTTWKYKSTLPEWWLSERDRPKRLKLLKPQLDGPFESAGKRFQLQLQPLDLTPVRLPQSE